MIGVEEMSEQIDWSQAPADATHYQAATHGVFECWLKPGHAVRVSRREPDWREDEYADDLIATSAIKRPWSGEGLPPVGVVCDFKSNGNQWGQVKVLTHLVEMQKDHPCAVAQIGETGPLCIGVAAYFRPIRTHEQIAADERKSVIDVACDDIEKQIDKYNTTLSQSIAIKATIEAMIDAGYRKP